MSVLEWSRHHRCFPGQGALDVVPLVAKVLELGYAGPLSLEVFNDVVREAAPQETALDAYRSLLFLQDELRRRLPAGTTRGRDSSRPHRHRLAPTRPSSSWPSATTTRRVALLEGLGFTRAGEHRSKPVTWWRNGDAHLVLNRGEESRGEHGRPVAVGLVADPVTDIAARAEVLRWPGWPPSDRRARPGCPV